jgi:hypothetical protein
MKMFTIRQFTFFTAATLALLAIALNAAQRRSRWLALCAFALGVVAPSANAADGATVAGMRVPTTSVYSDADKVAAGSRAYGTTALSVHTVHAFAFEMYYGTSVARSHAFRGCNEGSCIFIAPVMIPSGSLVTSIQLDGCDINSGSEIGFELASIGTMKSSYLNRQVGTTTGAPGCVLQSAINPAPFTIDNLNHAYIVTVYTSAPAYSSEFQAVRIFYQRQISPAPGSATFTDVPTSHSFHRHIEALVASGITAGCGGGNFCPDATVTRGQMAVFLAKALGLHWPN